jgi:hypothetical protein
MHVILVAPHFPANQRQFARALKSVGAYVSGIGEASPQQLDGELRQWVDHWEQVPNVCDEQALLEAVRRIQRRGWVDRLEATVEAHVLAAARVRELTGIPGISYRTTMLCRDKPEMKEHLRQHRIPTAQSTGVETFAEAKAFADRVGYPLILKPRAGAGAAGTSRVDNDEQLKHAGAEFGLDRGASAGLEEFIEGHEGFYDTLTVNGQVHHEFISHYYPNVLDAMRNRWISPYLITTNRMDVAGYNELKKLGRDVIGALGLGTTATHMEWFYGPKGLKFSEIASRPPGVCTWDLYCAANGIDLYREWALAVCYGKTAQRPSRQFAAGMIAVRPNRDGRITGYEGVDQIERELGPSIIDMHLPPIGGRTQPVEAGFMANAWLRLRHPDYDTMRQIMDWIGKTLKVYAK